MPRAGALHCRHSLPVIAVVTFLAGSLTAPPARAGSIESPTVVNPAIYRSSSGAYELHIEPTQREGKGPAGYCLTHDGQRVWEGELPYTLVDAVAMNDGVVAGYAYGCGSQRGSCEDSEGKTHLRLVILDPSGRPRLDRTVETKIIYYPSIPHVSQPALYVLSVLPQPAVDRVTFRLQTEQPPNGDEEWWPFRLSTGESQPSIRLRTEPDEGGAWLSRFIDQVVPVEGTGLALVHWWWRTTSQRSVGARFALIDEKGSAVWELLLPRDYQVLDNPKAQDALATSVSKHGAILSASAPRTFEIRMASTAERITLSVTPSESAPGKWVVAETGRRRWVEPPQPPDLFAGIEPIDASLLREVPLGRGDTSPDPPIRGVRDFDLDAQGHLGFVRDDGAKGLAFVIVDGEGRVVRDARLPFVAAASEVASAWVSGDRWLVLVTWGDEPRAVWVFEGKPEPVDASSMLPRRVRQLASRNGHGFLVVWEDARLLDSGWSESRSVVTLFDDQGQINRTIRPDEGTGFDEFDRVAVLLDGTVVALQSIAKRILFLGSAGKLERIVDLSEAWKREPRYLAAISRDADDGFIVEDFEGAAPFVRMRPDGSVRAELHPRHANGKPTKRICRIRVGADGGFWASDGEVLFRLNGEGIVGGTLGDPVVPTRLSRAINAQVDASARLHALDNTTGVVHVFDSDGQALWTCAPSLPAGPNGASVIDALTAPDGSVWVQDDPNTWRATRFVHCDREGRRVGVVDTPTAPTARQGPGRRSWTVDSRDLVLTGATGTILQRIERRPDRNWLETLHENRMAPDGALAVVSSAVPFSMLPVGEAWTVNLYAPDARPVRTLEMPGNFYARLCAYQGQELFFRKDEEVFVLDDEGHPRQRLHLAGLREEAIVLLNPTATEIWVLDGARNVLRRFVRPPSPQASTPSSTSEVRSTAESR
jgi:hypothetical protein